MFSGRKKMCLMKGKLESLKDSNPANEEYVPLKHITHNIKTNNDLA